MPMAMTGAAMWLAPCNAAALSQLRHCLAGVATAVPLLRFASKKACYLSTFPYLVIRKIADARREKHGVRSASLAA